MNINELNAAADLLEGVRSKAAVKWLDVPTDDVREGTLRRIHGEGGDFLQADANVMDSASVEIYSEGKFLSKSFVWCVRMIERHEMVVKPA